MQGTIGPAILKLCDNAIFATDQDRKVFINRNEIISILIITDTTDKNKNAIKIKLKSGDEHILGTYSDVEFARKAVYRLLQSELYTGVIEI